MEIMKNPGKIMESGRVLLISMPFALPSTPSIQLGTLSSYLTDKGIAVDVHHAYLECADILGPKLYHIISDTFFHEVFYPFLLFPEHVRKYRSKIRKHFSSTIRGFADVKSVRFETVLDRITSFNEELLTTIDFSKYRLIGFSVTYDQLRPSIYIARRIKQKYPDIPIVFGGGRCTDELGVSLLKTFSEIDFIVSGEGEETLTSLFHNLNRKEYDEIKGIIWRDNESVKFNGPPDKLLVENLPIPDYEDYFEKLEGCSQNSKDFIRSYLSIPVEGSRGCWWNKCTFCQLNQQYSRYREKSANRIIHEVRHQVEKYECHSIKFVDNVQRINNFDKLMSGMKDLDMNLNIFLELRAGRLKKKDYELMREAGTKFIQIGIEAFGNRMLQKMDKGITTIENIAALKYCQELGILPYYNILIYPNDNDLDLQESAENVKFLKNLVPPGSIHNIRIYHGSQVYNNLKEFNIKDVKIPKNSLWFYPKTVWQTLLPHYFDYVTFDDSKGKISLWYDIFREWKQTGEKRISSHILYYQDAGDFLTVTDKLSENITKEILKGIEREIYLLCDTIQTKSDILNHFPTLSSDHLDKILERWVAKHWMFREGDKLLSLAIKLNPMISPLTYHSDMYPYSDEFLNRWRPPQPRCKISLHLGSVADVSFSIIPNRIPAWLRRLKNRFTY